MYFDGRFNPNPCALKMSDCVLSSHLHSSNRCCVAYFMADAKTTDAYFIALLKIKQKMGVKFDQKNLEHKKVKKCCRLEVCWEDQLKNFKLSPCKQSE